MIPTQKHVRYFWEKYHLPEEKRIHCQLVAQVAQFISSRLTSKRIAINESLLIAAALLHDIDKNVPKRDGEEHPDAAIRILQDEHLDDLVPLVSSHAVHTILNFKIAPKTMEEKILFLSDKMVKYQVMTVDKRFELWNQEQLPKEGQKILQQAYPHVKKLEQEIFTILEIDPEDVAKYIK